MPSTLARRLLALSLSLSVASVTAKTAAEWRELSIYQVVTDRFAVTDGSSPSCDQTVYCGGSWQVS